MRRTTLTFSLLAIGTLLLPGCEMLGIETPAQQLARKEAEGKAIGSACRHAVRSIEDCFRSNPKAGKAAVFEGWKDMDAYMRENEIVGMPTAPGAESGAEAMGKEAAPAGGEPATPEGRKPHRS